MELATKLASDVCCCC